MPGEVLCLSLQRVWGWWHRAGRARAQPCLPASQPVCGILMSSAQCTASVCRDCLLPPRCLCSLLRCLGYFMSSFGCQAPSPSPWFPKSPTISCTLEIARDLVSVGVGACQPGGTGFTCSFRTRLQHVA